MAPNPADSQIAALLDSGLSPAQIATLATTAAASRETAASLAAMPNLASIAQLGSWLMDGKGTPDVQSELAAMSDAILGNDEEAVLAHAFQAVKNSLIALPHILKQAKERKAQTDKAKAAK
jgi:hypothetical protein